MGTHLRRWSYGSMVLVIAIMVAILVSNRGEEYWQVGCLMVGAIAVLVYLVGLGIDWAIRLWGWSKRNWLV